MSPKLFLLLSIIIFVLGELCEGGGKKGKSPSPKPVKKPVKGRNRGTNSPQALLKGKTPPNSLIKSPNNLNNPGPGADKRRLFPWGAIQTKSTKRTNPKSPPPKGSPKSPPPKGSPRSPPTKDSPPKGSPTKKHPTRGNRAGAHPLKASSPAASKVEPVPAIQRAVPNIAAPSRGGAPPTYAYSDASLQPIPCPEGVCPPGYKCENNFCVFDGSLGAATSTNIKRMKTGGRRVLNKFVQKPVAKESEIENAYQNIADSGLKERVHAHEHDIFHIKKNMGQVQAEQKDQHMKLHGLELDLEGQKAYTNDFIDMQTKNNQQVEEALNEHDDAIDALNEETERLDNVQQEHGQKIQKQREDFTEHKEQTAQNFAQHQAHLESHDQHNKAVDENLAVHAEHLKKNDHEIGNLNAGLDATNKKVAEHGDELIRQGQVQDQAVKDIKTLYVKGDEQQDLIDKQRKDFTNYTEETDNKFQKNNERFDGIDNTIVATNERIDKNVAELNNHSQQITGLGNDLENEASERKKVQSEHREELNAHKKQLEEHGEQLRQHSAKHVELKQNIGTVSDDLNGFKQSYAGDKAFNEERFADHGGRINAVTDHANKLQSQADQQGESLANAHGRLDQQGKELVDVQATNARHGETLKEHEGELASNRQQVGEIKNRLKGHDDKFVEVDRENEIRKSEIEAVQSDANMKFNKVNSDLLETNQDVEKNTKNIAENTEQIGLNAVRLGKAEVLLDEHGNKIIIHDNNFMEHGGRIQHIEERFKKQDIAVQKLIEYQKQIDEALMGANKVVVQKVAENEAKVMRAAEEAVENMKEALHELDEKTALIHSLQEKQQKIVTSKVAEPAA